jgi:hypothetical protein
VPRPAPALDLARLPDLVVADLVVQLPCGSEAGLGFVKAAGAPAMLAALGTFGRITAHDQPSMPPTPTLRKIRPIERPSQITS